MAEDGDYKGYVEWSYLREKDSEYLEWLFQLEQGGKLAGALAKLELERLKHDA